MRKRDTHQIAAGDSVAIIGFGVEGQSGVEYAQKRKAGRIDVYDLKGREAFNAHVIQAYENEGVVFHFGSEPRIGDFDGTDWIIRSPGVNPQTPYFAAPASEGKVTSTSRIFLDSFPRKNIIGVTGTKGKGTTSTLITEMFKVAGSEVYLGGNIGVPPLTFLGDAKKTARVVLEMSSFQLIDLTKSPHITVVLMTTVEHLNWHATEEEYISAKANLVLHQNPSDIAIVNIDYPNSRKIGQLAPSIVYWISTKQPVDKGCYIENGWLVFADKKKELIIPVDEIFIPGKHNWENAAAAVAAAKLSGVPTAAIVEVLRTFRGLEHRLEFVRDVNGVRYYNDSFSTVPETAIAAIRAFNEPKILLLGGSTKYSDFTELGNVIAGDKKIKVIIAIGPEWERIKDSIGKRRSDITFIETCTSMEEAVNAAHKRAKPGYVVVETPACASFAWHANYKERGKLFKEAVYKLVSSN